MSRAASRALLVAAFASWAGWTELLVPPEMDAAWMLLCFILGSSFSSMWRAV